VSFEALREWEVWVRYGVRVTRPERAVFDEMRRHEAREALVVLESALAARITSLTRFRAYASAHRSARRYPVVAWALPRARGGARSPAEVRVRTTAEEDAGWPRLLVNRVVRDVDGARVGEVDLVDPSAPAVIEVDGADHRDGRQQEWDITKEEALRVLGFEVARVTGRQALDAATLAPRLRAVRERALARGPIAPTWSLSGEVLDLDAWLAEREATAVFYENLPDAG
jgi:very-short-patch-repair endonuclease